MRLPQNVRVAITGAGSGLGRALAVELASQRQARLLLLDVNEPRAHETAELVRQAGGEARVMRCDVTQAQDLDAAAAEMDRAFGGTDLLVNNAGVAAAGLMGDVPIADWQWLLNINLFGVIHGCHSFVPRMKAQRAGFILNVASAAALAHLPEMSAYNVSKAGVLALSETLDAELASYGIVVSTLCPTFFATNLLESLRSPDNRQKDAAEKAFARTRVTASAVAKAALKGLEANQLVIIPQLDGAAIWRLKRVLPGVWRALLRLGQKHNFIGRWSQR